MNSKLYKTILSIIILGLTLTPGGLFADDIDDLNDQISEKRKQLEELDAEIERQRQLVNSASGRANNLQNSIWQLESSRNQLLSEIDETETKIEETELTISKLNIEIDVKENLIDRNSNALAESIRKISGLKSTSVVEKVLGFDTLSAFWNEFEQTERIQKRLSTEVDNLIDLNDQLKKQEKEKVDEKSELAQYQVELSSEKEAVEYTKQEQSVLLTQTKNEESTYQAILNEKLKEKEAFEQELLEIESQLNLLIDPDSYPDPGKGVISWPLNNIIITQYFGGTPFAKTNPHVYGRAFHPGVDFGIPIGSKVKSVAAGTVIGTGNTDAYPGCNAWGKWVVVQHLNGLSSLYAHLSSISVDEGDKVTTGQQIGLSGNTGVSTGPHLHLSLYASQGVQVGRYSSYKSGTGCAATNATGPFADLDAYLDPIQYLPSL